MTISNCPLCIDGFVPAGIDPILDALCRICPACGPSCPACAGAGVYPAATHCRICFVETLADLGYTPTLCAGCCGVVHVASTASTPGRTDT